MSATGKAVPGVEELRGEFPILDREVRPGVRLVYLDSAATSQKPRGVIEAMSSFYETQNANVHRGIHRLAEEATESFEGARARIAGFLGAASPREIIFTRNTTEAINLVAQSYARPRLHRGDEILRLNTEVPRKRLDRHMGGMRARH